MENHVIVPNDAFWRIFKPPISSYLENSGLISAQLADVLACGAELDDIKRLIPYHYSSSLVELEKKTDSILAEYRSNNKEIKSHIILSE